MDVSHKKRLNVSKHQTMEGLVRASESSGRTSSSSFDDQEPPRAPKKRKSTYYVRKEAIDVLQNQVEELQQKLTQTRQISNATPHILKLQRHDEIKRNHQLFAGLASMLSSYKQIARSFGTTPLATFIHLPVQQRDRNHKLCGLHRPKLDAAFRFIVERTRFLDTNLRHFHEELIHEPNGDVVSVRLDITPFERRYSLRQVYEAFKFCLVNQKKILTEVDPREYTDVYDKSFLFDQVQLTTTIPSGDGDVEVKSNTVTFLSFTEEPTEGAPLGGHAIATSDYVDQDDLEPCPSETVVCEELTSAVLVTETMTTAGAIVTICRWEHRRCCPPGTQPLTKLQVEELHATGKRRWEALLSVMHERLEALW